MSANAFLPSPQPRDFAQFSETVRPLGLYWLGLNKAPRERP
jgi:hypothetical protein